jgi:hypothetical protein
MRLVDCPVKQRRIAQLRVIQQFFERHFVEGTFAAAACAP